MAVSYDYFRIFYYVAQCKSFTRAAEALGNNQPNITRCMNNLEEELGCKLFIRSNRGVTLTPEGERLQRRVAVAWEQLQQGEEEIRRDSSLDTGVISIAASAVPLHLLLLDKLSIFRSRYPGVKLRVVNVTMSQAVTALRQGQVDCALVTTPVDVAPPLRLTQLRSFRDALICGQPYREVASKERSLFELREYPFVCQGGGSSTNEFYRRFFAKHDLPFHVEVEASTQDQILPMIRCGLGIGFMAESLAASALARGEVYRIPLTEEVPERFICLVEDDTRPQSVAFKALRKELFSSQEG